jgi:D-tagatose-1,6-bisphosphate aldolase subunit GatZ/KbaZ
MEYAEAMVAEYVEAGFTKIHLDASMVCSDDPMVLPDEVVAQRTVQLCLAAERVRDAGHAPVYVIGTEVPTPGGATHALDELQVTSTAAATHTLAVHKRVFHEQGLADAWCRVIALVVQPGVEFGHDSVIPYDREKAKPLADWLRAQPEDMVFEVHSTDYQLSGSYVELVEDGFAILKVGPALTFAMREALYALEDMESQLLPAARRSFLARTIEETMLREPEQWQAYYQGSSERQQLLRVYSYSDRMRYYWHRPEITAAVTAAVNRLISNLSSVSIPESMCSRYLPGQYERLRRGEIAGDAVSIIVDHVRDVLRLYAEACARQ